MIKAPLAEIIISHNERDAEAVVYICRSRSRLIASRSASSSTGWLIRYRLCGCISERVYTSLRRRRCDSYIVIVSHTPRFDEYIGYHRPYPIADICNDARLN